MGGSDPPNADGYTLVSYVLTDYELRTESGF